jgi:hypothetical protein
MKSLLIQRCPLWTLQSYDFDIHKIYGQSTPNEKALEVPSAILRQSRYHQVYPATSNVYRVFQKHSVKILCTECFVCVRVYQETVPMDHVPCALSQVLHS